MSTTERLTITLPADIAATVRRTVAEGGYASTSEVVREALEDWVRQRGAGETGLERLRAEVRHGLESGAPIPAEEVISELRARYASKA